MSNEQAIKILNAQIDSLQFVNYTTHKTWMTQTKSEIKKIFGIGSEESFFLISFSLVDEYEDASANLQLMVNKPTAIDFLKRCIQTIERDKPLKPPAPVIQYVDRPVEVIKRVEVIKEVLVYPPKVNYFLRFINWLKRGDILALIGTGILILGLPFWLGWELAENKGDIKNLELKRENKQLIKDTTSLGSKNRELSDSLGIYSTLDVPNAKTDSNAKGNKEKVRPDSPHK